MLANRMRMAAGAASAPEWTLRTTDTFLDNTADSNFNVLADMSNPQSGDLCILAGMYYDSDGNAPAPQTVSGWTRVSEREDGACGAAIWIRLLDGTETDQTFWASGGGATKEVYYAALLLTGPSTYTSHDVVSVNGGDSDTINATGATKPAIAIFASYGGTGSMSPSDGTVTPTTASARLDFHYDIQNDTKADCTANAPGAGANNGGTGCYLQSTG